MIGWHLPGPYQLALRSTSWHEVEHLCFFTGGSSSGGRSCSRGRPALAGLEPSSVSPARRPREHRPGRVPRLLGSRAVSGLRSRAAALRPLRLRRPGPGCRSHVGPRFAGVPGSGHGDHVAAALASRPCARRGGRGAARWGSGPGRASLRSPAHASRRPPAPSALRPPRAAGGDAPPGRGGRRGRAARQSDERDEPRRRAALDLWAWFRRGGPPRGRQRLLHGLPFMLPRELGNARLATRNWPRASARSGWSVSAGRVLLGYEAFSLWTARTPRPGSRGYFAAAFLVDTFFRAGQLLQIRLSHRAIPVRRVAGLAARGDGAEAGRVRGCATTTVCAATRRSAAARRVSTCRARWAT